VRALAFHLCDPGSILGSNGVNWLVSNVVLSHATKVLFWVLRFSSLNTNLKYATEDECKIVNDVGVVSARVHKE